MIYKLKNGAEVTGSIEQIYAIAKTLGEKVDEANLVGEIPEGFYVSEKRGVLPVKEVNAYHLRNAILKRQRNLLNSLVSSNTLSHQEFLNQLACAFTDTETFMLISELEIRVYDESKKLEPAS